MSKVQKTEFQVKKRQLAFQLEKFAEYVNNESSTVENITVRYEQPKELLNQYVNASLKLSHLDPAQQNSSEVGNFEKKFYETLTKAKTIIQTKEPGPTTSQNSDDAASKDKSKLKTPKLPSFTGGYKEWQTFKPYSMSLVHNTNFSKIMKFHHLKKAIRGKAAELIIRHLKLTEENYDIGLKTLTERYENEKYLQYQLVKQLLSVEDICPNNPKKLTAKQIENIYNRITQTVEGIEATGTKTCCGKSLNDILRAGPTIQDNLFSILLRFREYPIVMCADATKMFRQVLIEENQRKYQRILWRKEPSLPIEMYELNTVTYGTSPASFLAVRSLQETAHQYKNVYPSAVESILSDFYVDDFLGGGNNCAEIRKKKQQVEEILGRGHFHLRKLVYNDPSVFDHEKAPDDEQFYFNTSDEMKTLGVQWRPKTDKFSFKSQFQISSENQSVQSKQTKREIL